MTEYHLQHIHHESADVDATVQFYEKNFNGMLQERVERGGVQWARVNVGGVLINVTDRASKQYDLDLYQGLDHFALQTSDFDETIATLKSNGVVFWSEPRSPRPGVQVAFIAGPDNIKIEIMHMV